METIEKKNIVKSFLDKGYLISPSALENLNIASFENDLITEGIFIKGVKQEDKLEITNSFSPVSCKRSVEDFTSYFNKRFLVMESMLRNRTEMANAVSISRLARKQEKESVAIIGLVYDVATTKNGNIMLTIEDPTGMIKAVITNRNAEMFEQAKEIVYDEIVGVYGVMGKGIIFARGVVWPDVPLSKELKKGPDDSQAVFISDIEVGSKLFLKDSFEKFLEWINGKTGTDAQKELASKVKYLFIVGDLVNGVGIYPGQETELDILDIYEQYQKLAEYLERIPKRIKIVISPGNHDAMRIAEPQPPLYKDFAAPIYNISNAIMVANPSLINIHKTDTFPGFDVLLYHGFSFVYYGNEVDSIRSLGGQHRVDLIKKFLMKRRHLAPTHTSTLYVPEPSHDPLVIEKIPDFFASGHLHQTSVSHYRNITMMNCSCWIGQSSFQKKMGITPMPARALVANLKTREVKVMKF